jgi:hypothetical protein
VIYLPTLNPLVGTRVLNTGRGTAASRIQCNRKVPALVILYMYAHLHVCVKDSQKQSGGIFAQIPREVSQLGVSLGRVHVSFGGYI